WGGPSDACAPRRQSDAADGGLLLRPRLRTRSSRRCRRLAVPGVRCDQAAYDDGWNRVVRRRNLAVWLSGPGRAERDAEPELLRAAAGLVRDLELDQHIQGRSEDGHLRGPGAAGRRRLG